MNSTLHPVMQQAIAPFLIAPPCSHDKEVFDAAQAFQRCSCSTVGILVGTVEASIKAIGPLQCADVARILGALADQMKVSGFSDLDLQLLTQARDAICGEIA